MNFGQIRHYDVANGPGIRCSIFVTGCTRHCKDCFNEMYMDFQAGHAWTEKQTQQLIDYLKEDEIEGLTILGGEPFENAKGLIQIIRTIRKASDKSIWIYSGYTYEELLKNTLQKELLSLCDVLVDGAFIVALKNLRLKFRGSSNQRIIQILDSLEQNKVVLHPLSDM